MKKGIVILLLYFAGLTNGELVYARENNISTTDIRQNSVQTSIGLIDLNISYERLF